MNLRREVGFWPSLASLRIGQLVLAPEFLPSLVLGVGGGVWLLTATSLSKRDSIVGDYLVLLGPFVGVVLAGLAIVIALLSNSYLRLLNESPNGVIAFLRPFIIALGVQTGALIGGVTYRAIASEVPVRVEHVLFCVVSFLFVLGALEVIAVTRNLLAHALLRAKLVETEDLEAKGVRKLPSRQPHSG